MKITVELVRKYLNVLKNSSNIPALKRSNISKYDGTIEDFCQGEEIDLKEFRKACALFTPFLKEAGYIGNIGIVGKNKAGQDFWDVRYFHTINQMRGLLKVDEIMELESQNIAKAEARKKEARKRNPSMSKINSLALSERRMFFKEREIDLEKKIVKRINARLAKEGIDYKYPEPGPAIDEWSGLKI